MFPKKMAYINYKNLWESEFDNIVCTKDDVQDINIGPLNFKLIDSYKKDEKVTTSFKLSQDEDVRNKKYLDENCSKMEGHPSILERDYNEIKILSYKQSGEEASKQKAVKRTIERLYDRVLFDSFTTADQVIEAFLFAERRRPALEAVNDVIQ